MPLSDEDKQAVSELFNSALKPVQEKLARFESEFPGMSKRHAAEAASALKSDIEGLRARIPEPKENDAKPGEGKPNTGDLAGTVSKLQSELTAMTDKAALNEKRALVQSAFGKVQLVDGVADDYLDILVGKIKTVDGKHVMPSTRKLEATKEVITEEVPVEVAVQRFFDERPALKKASVKQGMNARGSEGGSGGGDDAFAGIASYSQLMRDPAKLRAAQKQDMAKVEALRSAHDQELRKKFGR